MDEEEREERRLRIAEAALRVFERQGFTHTRVEDICGEAGIAKGTYYLYFSSREEVLSVLLTAMFEEQRVALEKLAAGEGPLPDLAEVMGGMIDASVAHREFIPVFWEVAGHRVVQSEFELNRRLGELFAGFGRSIEQLLARSAAEGRVPTGLNIRAFARMIVSAVDGIVLHAALFDAERAPSIEEQKLELMRMIRATLGRRTE